MKNKIITTIKWIILFLPMILIISCSRNSDNSTSSSLPSFPEHDSDKIMAQAKSAGFSDSPYGYTVPDVCKNNLRDGVTKPKAIKAYQTINSHLFLCDPIEIPKQLAYMAERGVGVGEEFHADKRWTTRCLEGPGTEIKWDYFKFLNDECQDLLRPKIMNILESDIGLYTKEMQIDWKTAENPTGKPTLVALEIKGDFLSEYFEILSVWHRNIFDKIMRLKEGEVASKDVRESSANITRDFWNKVSDLLKEKDLLVRKENFLTTYRMKIDLLVVGLKQKDIPSIVLLSFLGDGLRPLYERLEVLSSLKDMQCLVENCQQVNAERKNLDEIYTTLKLLGSLFDKENFKKQKDKLNLNLSSDFKKLFEGSYSTGVMSLLGGNAPLEEAIKFLIKDSDLALANNKDIDDKTKIIRLLSKDVAVLPDYAQAIVGIIKGSRHLTDAFDSTGLYAGKQAAHIKFGFDKDKFKEIENLKDRLVGDLIESQSKFITDKEKLIQQVMNEKELAQKKNILLKDLDEASTELLFEMKKLNATRAAISENSRRQGERMSGFSSMMKSEKWKKLYANQNFKIAEVNMTIKPSDAKFIRGEQNLNFIAVSSKGLQGSGTDAAGSDLSVAPGSASAYKVSASKGDMIQLQVRGSWSPTCALTKAGYSKENIKDAQTGPEGYNMVATRDSTAVVSSANSHSVSESYSKDEYEDNSRSAKACIGAQAKTGTPLEAIIGSGVSVYANAEACTSHVKGTRWTHANGRVDNNTTSTTNSQSDRTDASFRLGIRLADTPFSDMPAGSLLMVEMKKDAISLQEGLQNVYVVERDGSFLAAGDRDYYLVINDCTPESSESSSSNAGKLDVNITMLKPQGGMAQNMAKSMLESLTEITTQSDKYIGMGQMTSNDVQLLRDGVINKFSTNSEGDAFDNQMLRQTFQYWINQEISILEKKIVEQNLLQTLELKNNKISHLNKQIEAIDSQKDIGGLSKLWILDNTDLSAVGKSLGYITEFFNDFYYPVYKYAYPGIVNKTYKWEEIALRTVDVGSSSDSSSGENGTETKNDILKAIPEIKQSLNSVGKITINSNFLDIALEIKNLFKIMTYKGKFFDIEKTRSGSKFVYLGYPNPEFITESDNLFDDESGADYPVATLADAKKLWDTINTPGVLASMEVRPEHLYNDKYLYGLIGRDEVYPVVTAITIFIVTNDVAETKYDDINNKLTENPFPLNVSEKLTYVTKDGPDAYFLTSDAWRKPRANVLVGRDADMSKFVKTYVNPQANYLGQGLTPFATFSLDLFKLFKTRELKQLKASNKIKEIRIVFNIEHEISDRNIDWIGKLFDKVATHE